MQDREDEDLPNEVPNIHIMEAPSWPQLLGVPLSQRRRVWCLLTAMEVVPNVGGRPATDVVRDAILAANMLQEFIVTNKLPIPKPQLVETKP